MFFCKYQHVFLAGTVATFIINGESYALNSTHDAWCENDEIISNTMFGLGVVPPPFCKPTQLIINKQNNFFYSAAYITSSVDQSKNFFACH
jgi:hypothetical protein